MHESAQRRGIGGALFDHFLRRENKNPARLAYDRPSEKLFAFLAKNFSLTKYQPQTNNFVVFDAYFAVAPRPASAAKELRKLTQGRGVGLAAAARAKAAAARAARQEAEKKNANAFHSRRRFDRSRNRANVRSTAEPYQRSRRSIDRNLVHTDRAQSIKISRGGSRSRGNQRVFESAQSRNRARDSGRREIRAERRDSERETKQRR